MIARLTVVQILLGLQLNCTVWRGPPSWVVHILYINLTALRAPIWAVFMKHFRCREPIGCMLVWKYTIFHEEFSSRRIAPFPILFKDFSHIWRNYAVCLKYKVWLTDDDESEGAFKQRSADQEHGRPLTQADFTAGIHAGKGMRTRKSVVKRQALLSRTTSKMDSYGCCQGWGETAFPVFLHVEAVGKVTFSPRLKQIWNKKLKRYEQILFPEILDYSCLQVVLKSRFLLTLKDDRTEKRCQLLVAASPKDGRMLERCIIFLFLTSQRLDRSRRVVKEISSIFHSAK